MVTVTELVCTCTACPAQWEGRTYEGQYVYVRYRFGWLQVGFGDTRTAAIDDESILRQLGDGFDGFLSVNDLRDATGEFDTLAGRPMSKVIQGGGFYQRRTPRSPLEFIGKQVGDVAIHEWICRRVADFPKGLAPEGSVTGTCSKCQAPIAYDPRRILQVPPSTPQVCMQCARIEPLPIPE